MGKKRPRERHGKDRDAQEEDMQVDEPVESLTDLNSALDAIAKQPQRYELYTRALELAQGYDEKDMTRQLFVQAFPLSGDLWREWIVDRQAVAQASPSEESYKAVLELFELSAQDVKSIPLMQLLVDYLLREYYAARGLVRPDSDQINAGESVQPDSSGSADAAKQDIWSDDIVLQLLQRTAIQSSYDAAQSEPIWQALFAFMRDLYTRKPSDELKERIKDFFLIRLGEPHANHEQTMQAYSSFTTATDQANYEALLVEAQSVYSPAKAKFAAHEKHEAKLATEDVAYIHYATSLEKQNEPEWAVSTYERGVSAYPSSVDIWEAYLRSKYSSMRAKMTAGDFDTTSELASEMLDIASRAVRFVPSSSATWISLMNANERLGDLSTVEATFARALTSGHFGKNVEELVKLYTARADIHRQAWQEIVAGESSLEESPGFVEVDAILKEGIAAVKKAVKGGDPSFRLERYLVRFYERNDNLQEAIEVMAQTTEAHKKSYAVWVARADLYVRHGHLDTARAVYQEAMKLILDYPEYLFDAYVTFEHNHGSLHEIQEAEVGVAAKMRYILKNRQDAAMAEWQAAQQQSVEAAPADSAMQVDSQPTASTSQQPVASTSQQPVASTSSSVPKRAAEEINAEASSSKRAKTDHAPAKEVKRDRERTTVIVSKLPAEAEEDDLRRLFNDCGAILEIKLFADAASATVEFVRRESVPMAKTKDKKLIKGVEVDVNAAWASTLWLTNFPAGTDDPGMRKLLEPYGKIIEIRWPDRNFKTTRRFAYVTMSSESSAHAAIAALHGKTIEGSQYPMQVHISDPERKSARSDASANAREVRVSNLKPSVTKELLTKVFAECGVVKDVRLDGKGNAFVEYEEEDSVGKAVQTLNDHELVGWHIAVTRVEHRGGPGHRPQGKGKAGKSRNDFQARVVRLTNLPTHAQTGLLRQDLEKLQLNVVEIALDDDGQGASVEFASMADAGKALLLPAGSLGSIVISEAPPTGNKKSAGASKASAPAETAFAPRNVGGGRGRGAGRGGRGGFAGGARAGIGAEKSNGSQAKGQDAFRAMLAGKSGGGDAMQE